MYFPFLSSFPTFLWCSCTLSVPRISSCFNLSNQLRTGAGASIYIPLLQKSRRLMLQPYLTQFRRLQFHLLYSGFCLQWEVWWGKGCIYQIHLLCLIVRNYICVVTNLISKHILFRAACWVLWKFWACVFIAHGGELAHNVIHQHLWSSIPETSLLRCLATVTSVWYVVKKTSVHTPCLWLFSSSVYLGMTSKE